MRRRVRFFILGCAGLVGLLGARAEDSADGPIPRALSVERAAEPDQLLGAGEMAVVDYLLAAHGPTKETPPTLLLSEKHAPSLTRHFGPGRKIPGALFDTGAPGSLFYKFDSGVVLKTPSQAPPPRRPAQQAPQAQSSPAAPAAPDAPPAARSLTFDLDAAPPGEVATVVARPGDILRSVDTAAADAFVIVYLVPEGTAFLPQNFNTDNFQPWFKLRRHAEGRWVVPAGMWAVVPRLPILLTVEYGQ